MVLAVLVMHEPGSRGSCPGSDHKLSGIGLGPAQHHIALVLGHRNQDESGTPEPHVTAGAPEATAGEQSPQQSRTHVTSRDGT